MKLNRRHGKLLYKLGPISDMFVEEGQRAVTSCIVRRLHDDCEEFWRKEGRDLFDMLETGIEPGCDFREAA